MATQETVSVTNVLSGLLVDEGRRPIPRVSALGYPGRTGASPGRKRIPFRPPHPALFIADLDKDKGSVILAGFRTRENCRNSVCVPDGCCVCHSSPPFFQALGMLAVSILTALDYR
jgi:hypothetical protein